LLTYLAHLGCHDDELVGQGLFIVIVVTAFRACTESTAKGRQSCSHEDRYWHGAFTVGHRKGAAAVLDRAETQE